MDGKAQSTTEFSGMGDSCRVVGCDLFSETVQTGSGSAALGFNGVVDAVLTPGNISPRLRNLEELYEFYAIRKLMIQYMPLCPTTTAGAVALGIQQSALGASAVTVTTQQQVLEMTPSVLTPVWQSASTIYTHSGTKVWMTSTGGASDQSEDVQMLVNAVIAGGAVSTNYGQLRLEYVIDFYKPTPIQTGPSERKVQYRKSVGDFQRWLKTQRSPLIEEKQAVPPATVADSRDCSTAAGVSGRKRKEPPDDDNSSGFTFVDRASGQSKRLTIDLPKTGTDTPRMRTRSLERELK
jgi:hypothetical protein